ncbi:glutathione S-transferase P isoform X1 [Prionailurus iriomotensis]
MRAHAIRLLLAYTDSHYEGKKYTVGDAPDYDRSQWLDEKFKLGLDFPNIEGGETEEEMIHVDILENQATDASNQLTRVCYSPDFIGEFIGWTMAQLQWGHWGSCTTQGSPASLPRESVPESGDGSSVPQERLKPVYLESIPGEMKLYSQFLGKRPWFAGEKITCLDCLAYDILDLHCIFEPKSLDAFPNLKEFVARFEGLKKISAYMKSSRFLPGPLFLKIAFWGNK